MSFTSDPGKSLVGQRGGHTLSMSSRKLILSIFGFQELIFCNRVFAVNI